MSDYKITRISQDPPREWNNPKGGTVYYRKVMLEGWDKPVSVGKKSADALHVGDVLQGTITPDPEHGEDKFKADAAAFTGGGGGSSHSPAPRGTTPEDKESIARAVALKAAVDYYPSDANKVTPSDVIEVAERFLAWLKGNLEATDAGEPTHEPIDEGF